MKKNPAAWETEAVPEDVYAEVARSLASAESPVGIDAKHTHVLILHALDRIERRLDSGRGAGDAQTEAPATIGQREAEVRRQVRQLLERSPAYAELGSKRQERLADGLTHMVMLIGEARRDVVDFPGFVAALIEGTFEAIVDASIKQMEAYADLIEEATAGLDEFVSGSRSEAAGRQRQQLLATMVLMGVARIKVGGRGIRARAVFGEDDRDDE